MQTCDWKSCDINHVTRREDRVRNSLMSWPESWVADQRDGDKKYKPYKKQVKNKRNFYHHYMALLHCPAAIFRMHAKKGRRYQTFAFYAAVPSKWQQKRKWKKNEKSSSGRFSLPIRKCQTMGWRPLVCCIAIYIFFFIIQSLENWQISGTACLLTYI